ncbi:cation diffusion facilitator family transporter [Aliikangiella sp. G2MR2-5]|uniref:cation diffusion facilitator family transporter n=1 Tax=Aliikangiella sp. G2MR2-5 TaxID=2788943 RepID=UPI0018A9AC22|nr:cation diffusion facilitator family transporter [Aliikangiella sp. G2MR2-5]
MSTSQSADNQCSNSEEASIQLPQKSASISSMDRQQKVRRIILIEGMANLVVLLAKSAIGFTTGSMAIIGDALHSLTDVANNIVAWAVVKHSEKPADKEHPYGHHKFETLAVLGLAVLLVVLAFELAINAIRGSNEVPVTSNFELAVMVGVLMVNIGLASWQRFWANKLDSSILKADAHHTFADVLTTIVVIGGWQLAVNGFPILDKICALGVSGLILYLAYELFKKAAPILVDEYAVDPDQVSKLVLKYEPVEKVSRIRSRWIGNHATLDMIIHVAPDLTTEESHQICDELEDAIEAAFNISDISIHVEPYKD